MTANADPSRVSSRLRNTGAGRCAYAGAARMLKSTTPVPVDDDTVRREKIARLRKLEMDLLCESRRAGQSEDYDEMLDLSCCRYLVAKVLRKAESGEE